MDYCCSLIIVHMSRNYVLSGLMSMWYFFGHELYKLYITLEHIYVLYYAVNTLQLYIFSFLRYEQTKQEALYTYMEHFNQLRGVSIGCTYVM